MDSRCKWRCRASRSYALAGSPCAWLCGDLAQRRLAKQSERLSHAALEQEQHPQHWICLSCQTLYYDSIFLRAVLRSTRSSHLRDCSGSMKME